MKFPGLVNLNLSLHSIVVVDSRHPAVLWIGRVCLYRRDLDRVLKSAKPCGFSGFWGLPRLLRAVGAPASDGNGGRPLGRTELLKMGQNRPSIRPPGGGKMAALQGRFRRRRSVNPVRMRTACWEVFCFAPFLF